jgi:DNA-binding XRE family transcriptional regulator
MGEKAIGVKILRGPEARHLPPPPAWAKRSRPRSYLEWRTLREWGRLPPWEPLRPGYVLRAAREQAGLTQEELADRLGVSQQAVARAERCESNPTVSLMQRWARACGAELEVEVG